MTFDDGTIKIYTITNTASAGAKPAPALGTYQSHCFSYDTLGVNRYYTALQAGQQIEHVVSIPDWWDIPPNTHIAMMEDSKQFRILMAQRTTDDDGLQITRLSLERVGEDYAVVS